jgi:hypothetical protein
VHLVYLSKNGAKLQRESLEKMSEATRKSDEKATAVEKLRLGLKSASAKSVACERPKPSWSS